MEGHTERTVGVRLHANPSVACFEGKGRAAEERQAEDAHGPADGSARDRRVPGRPRRAGQGGGGGADRLAVRVRHGPAPRPQGRVRVRPVGRQAGIEGLHPHKLRHTFATLAQEAGVSVKKIQEAVDHAQLGSLPGVPDDLVRVAHVVDHHVAVGLDDEFTNRAAAAR
ncbi:tyrosine-type recombinase/integrase [Nonomuraea sp. NPDC050227]|uniref:tyrosine-type recombinase/integrase n=1 Tax=Nonomuraea sp. NPDC050227 TaxID=3364360 RepID=UPI0037BB22F5